LQTCSARSQTGDASPCDMADALTSILSAIALAAIVLFW
jgi:hypothetical protein